MRRQRSANPDAQRIAISGSSGLIGSSLSSLLESGGHRVDRVVRTAPRPGTTDIQWDPPSRWIDRQALEGVDAVVHLAGANIAAGRWTASRKESIRSSRVDSTRHLCETLAGLEARPSVLIAASAIGFYGDRGNAVMTEEHHAGSGFLAEVCRAWEDATSAAREADIRVVNLRIGVVLAAAGGALAKMLTPFKLGLGGRLGTGRQYMSWIALDDLVGMIHHLLFADDVSGPVNAVAPNPVTNAEFTKTLGRVLRRPTIFPVPASMVRLAFGEMGRELLLASTRVDSAKVRQSGFEFLHPELEETLRLELDR